MHVLVSVPTYKRAHNLREFLTATVPQIAASGATLLVTDNDPQGSARPIAEGYQNAADVRYVIEARPGIAAARNAGLNAFAAGDWDAIVFVDDDEVPREDWLQQLTMYSAGTASEVVTGPVISVLPDDAPRWILNGGFFQRRVRQTGSRSWTAATNNTLLKRQAWLRAGSPSFDSSFSRTGGSDTDFFARVASRGAVIEYCADAVVSEKVPTVRLSRKWLNRRALRTGVVNGIVLRRTRGPLHLFVLGVTNLIFGVALSGWDALRGRYPTARGWNRSRYGFALAASQLGWRVHEYDRG